MAGAVDAFHGLRMVEAGLIEMARSDGMPGLAPYRHGILPVAVPQALVTHHVAEAVAPARRVLPGAKGAA